MSELDAKQPRIALLGIPIEIGASQAGTLMGPAALRTAGIARVLDQLGFCVEDHGDLAISDVSSDGPPPANANAHADYNTPATTVTGNMHGMSAAFLCGEPGLDGLLGDQPRASITPDQLDLFGIRSIDPLEKKLIRDRPIAMADMRAIDEHGVGVLIRRVIERVKARNGVLHVSFDVDFLDPAVAPGVGTTVPGGATYREAHLIMELLHDSGLVRSLDIVELNPFLDERGRTARVAVELIGSLFGLQITDRPTPSNAVFPD